MIRHLYKFANGELFPISHGDQEDFISNYIKDWKATNNSSEIKFGEAFYFYAVYHSMEDLYSGNDYFFVETKKDEDQECDFPVIHLTMFDIFTPPKDSITIPNVKRYKKIIDSSIWSYYVPFYGTEVMGDKNTLIEELNYEQFNRTLAEISQNTQNGLYNLQVSHEYADLNARLQKQSYLTGTHSQISPFLFHSENEMRMKIEDLKKENVHSVTLQTLQKYRWRFLLLDDHCIKPLSPIKNKTIADADSKPVNINKLQIIAHNLSRILCFDENKIWFRAFIETEAKVVYGRVADGKFQSVHELPSKPEDIQIIIDCVEEIKEAEYCLQNYSYEIVFLDYLLKEDKKEYGYQLLEHLHDWSRNKEKRIKEKNKNPDIFKPGPNKRFFFMFISAFTTAVHERMLEKGFGRRERGLWIIGDGACPTNTPYLFSYYLMDLMRQRIRDLKKGNEGGYLTLIELLNEIFVRKDDDGPEDIRQKAHDNFNNLLFMCNKYRQLENDLKVDDERNANRGDYIIKMKGSLLIQSVYKYVNHFSGAFFEHLQHLVYLTAYGTIRQWQDMWEEYVFINNELSDYDKLLDERDENGKLIKKGKAVSDAIRDYIINLKENNY